MESVGVERIYDNGRYAIEDDLWCFQIVRLNDGATARMDNNQAPNKDELNEEGYMNAYLCQFFNSEYHG